MFATKLHDYFLFFVLSLVDVEIISSVYAALCHNYLDALNITNLSSLKERRFQLCSKYIRKMSQSDHPLVSLYLKL